MEEENNEQPQEEVDTMPEFLVHDESISDHGCWVLTKGIDISQFLRNPVMLCQHEWGYGSFIHCGIWENIRVDGTKIYATPKPNEATQLGRELKESILNGTIKACSIAVWIIETSEEDKYIKKGQRRATITKSELYEISLVTFPANKNALVQNSSEVPKNLLKLSVKDIQSENLPPLLNTKEKANKKPLDNLSKQQLPMDEKEQALAEMQDLQVDLLLTLGRTNGHVTKENEESYKELAKKSPKALHSIFSQKAPTAPDKEEKEEDKPRNKGRESLTEALKNNVQNPPTTPVADERENWTHKDWSKKDPQGLETMRLQEPEKYSQLASAMGKPWFANGKK